MSSRDRMDRRHDFRETIRYALELWDALVCGVCVDEVIDLSEADDVDEAIEIWEDHVREVHEDSGEEVLLADGGLEDSVRYRSERPQLWTLGRPMGPYQGSFPLGFLNRLDDLWSIRSREVLFPFGGTTPNRENWTVNDINEDLDVDTHHDARDLPDEWEESFEVVVSDPPYSEEYARDLYDVEFPGYKAHFVEAERVLRPGGWLLILDWICYENYCPDSLKRQHSIAVTCGPNTRIRNLNVFRKRGSLDPRGTLGQWSGGRNGRSVDTGSDREGGSS